MRIFNCISSLDLSMNEFVSIIMSVNYRAEEEGHDKNLSFNVHSSWVKEGT